jgi:nicotinate-nucleotide adenylyltransferase
MTKLALQELGDPRMVADDREIFAAKNGASNYTADTLVSLQQDYPGRKLIWILGEDQLQNFLSWSRWQWLIHQVDLAVCARPGAEGSKVAKTLTESGGKIHWVHLQPDTVSSTEIRSAIQAGVLVPGLIPVSVADYISAGFLYR